MEPRIDLPTELAGLVEEGVSIIVGTRDAALQPESLRAVGARLDAERGTVTVFLPAAVAGPTLANLLENGRIATTFSRIADHRTFQTKGRALAITVADAADRARVERYRRAIADELAVVGLPHHLVFRLNHWPCYAVRFAVDSVFDQTPGPGAGACLRQAAQPAGQPTVGKGLELATGALLRTSVDALDLACFQGLVPSLLTTCDREGEPNITYLSQVERLDSSHVALSCQFFNKTKRNLLENPFSSLIVYHPARFEAWRLKLAFEREETSGPLFDTMAARIQVIASHTGMAGVFKLLSADIHRVLAVDRIEAFLLPLDPAFAVPPVEEPPPGTRLTELKSLQAVSARLARATLPASLLDSALAALDDLLGLDHTMVFLAEAAGLRLAASRGYSCHSADCPGIVVDLGAGIVGTAAERRTAVLLRGLGGGLSYGRAIRSQAAGRATAPLQAEVALPGLVDAQVQLALPMIVGEQLAGVLVAESANPLAFDEWDEVFLQIVANEIAMRLTLLAGPSGLGGPPPAPNPRSLQSPPPADRTQVRRFTLYRNDDCVFVDGEYLVRNVPGRILWKMLRRFHETGQDEFANREFRLDPSLGLPRYRDNLESRLILLRRRLEERCADVRMVPTRRGRFRLELAGPIALEERDSA